VQKNHWRAIGRTCFGVCNIQDAGIDLLEWGERSIRSRPDRRQLCLSCLARLRIRRPDHAKLSGRGHNSSADEITAAQSISSAILVVLMVIGAASLALLYFIPAPPSKITMAAR
jgi:hypothetical protein